MPERPQPRPMVAEGTTLLDVTDAAAATVPPVPATQDPVAAYYCKTLREVQDRAYDVVVVGGGAVGSAVVHRLLTAATHRTIRVLVLEKGSFLLPEHVQNLDPRYQRLMADAVAKPWKLAPGTTYDLAPQIPYFGGRALFWSTWIPQPARTQMPNWPGRVLDELDSRNYWQHARDLLGAVQPSDMGPEFSTFQPRLRQRLMEGLRHLEYFLPYSDAKALEVPLASRATTSTLQYRKFSPVPVLLRDADEFVGSLDIVTGCEVEQIRHAKPSGKPRTATELITTQGRLQLRGAALVLANGVIEPTGLLLDSFGEVLPDFTGTNLGGHVASWFSARVPRRAWPDLGNALQVGCVYVKGRVPNADADHNRDFHIHLMGASNPHPKTAVADLYRLIPDSFDQEFLHELSDRDHIGFLVHTLGEWRSKPKDRTGSWVGFDQGRTVLSIKPGPVDNDLRTKMDRAAQQMVAKVLASGVRESEIDYWQPGAPGKKGQWVKTIPPERLKDVLVHESGTLWMGESAADSVTDLDCRLHGVANVYVGGAATFPTSGSWNPTLTAVALAYRLADHLLTARGR
jgi:choline dehydrogenase-like flavoprotein